VRDIGDEDLAGLDLRETCAGVLAGGTESAGIVEVPRVAADEAVIADEFIGGAGDSLSPPFAAPNSASVCHASPVSCAGADGRQETGDVLKKEPAWAQVVGQPHDVPEQPRTCATQARAASRHGEVLAGEAPGDDASSWNKSSCSQLVTRNLRHVVEQLGLREVAGEHAPACAVDLHRRSDMDTCALKGQVKPADAGEQ